MYRVDFSRLEGDAAIAVKCWLLSQLCPVSSMRHIDIVGLRRKIEYISKFYIDISKLYGITGFLSPSVAIIKQFKVSMRGLMYTTQCTKSHIYLYFLEYVQEIFGIEQDKEGLDLLRIIDTKKVTAIVAANVRKPINHIYLGKLQKICIHALTDKTMEEDRIVSAVLLLLIYTGRRIGEVLHTEIQAVQYTSYKWFHDCLKAAKLNAAKGLVNAAEREENRALWLARKFVLKELPELEAEIARHSEEKIIEWYPDLQNIIKNLAKIKEEINLYISSKG